MKPDYYEFPEEAVVIEVEDYTEGGLKKKLADHVIETHYGVPVTELHVKRIVVTEGFVYVTRHKRGERGQRMVTVNLVTGESEVKTTTDIFPIADTTRSSFALPLSPTQGEQT